MKLPQGARRAAIFAFYDKDGIVDDYIPVLVGAVRRHCARLLCVVNGELTEAGRAKLAPVCDEILMRPNEGLDVTGYKEGFFHLEGELEQFDELLFFNQTVFGPLYPLGELFDEMAGRDLDFWGLSRHKGLQRDLTGTVWEKVEYGYIPPHVQSYFFAVRGELLRGGALGEYWRALPVIHDYIEAVSFHEMRFTKFFADQGYRWQVYLDCGDWERFLDYPLMGAPARLLESARLPLVKRKSFITPRSSYRSFPQGGAGWELLCAIAEKTDYDIRLILQNITRTAPMTDLFSALAPSCCPHPPRGRERPPREERLAVVVWLGEGRFLPLAENTLAALRRQDRVCFLLAEGVDPAPVAAAWPQAEIRTTPKDGFAALMGELWPKVGDSDAVLYLPLALRENQDGLQDLTRLSQTVAALGDPDEDFRLLDRLPGVELLVPAGDEVDDDLCTLTRADEPAELRELLEKAPFAGLPVGERLRRLPGNAFFAHPAALRPLSQLDWSDPALAAPGAPLAELLLPLAVQRAGALYGVSLPWRDAARALWNARETQDRFSVIFETPRHRRVDLLEHRMRYVMDFYDERHDQMTLEQAFAARLGLKQKLWILARLFFPRLFDRLHRR